MMTLNIKSSIIYVLDNLCTKVRVMNLKCRGLGVLLSLILVLLIWNEFIVYFLVLLQCYWPSLNPLKIDSSLSHNNEPVNSEPLKAMFLADTHVLGSQGHWFDVLRRLVQSNLSNCLMMLRPLYTVFAFIVRYFFSVCLLFLQGVANASCVSDCNVSF